MINILKNLSSWFIALGLSFLISYVLNWDEQGKIFLYIFIGMEILPIIIMEVLTFPFKLNKSTLPRIIIYIVIISLTVMLVIAGQLLITLFISKLFAINFYIVYEVVTFYLCVETYPLA